MRTRPAERARLAPPALVALLTLATLELVRASGPLIDLALTRADVPGAVGAALLGYLAAGPAAGLLLLLGRRRAPDRLGLLPAAVLVALLRLVVQGLDGDARFVVGLTAVAVAVAALTLAVAVLAGRPDGGRGAARAVAAGLAAAAGLQLALGTWDAVWRHTAVGWAVALAEAGLLTTAALAARRRPDPDLPPASARLWALGPVLALAAMMLANPAYAAAQSGWPLALAGPVHALGLLLAAAVVGRSRTRSWPEALGLPLAVALGLVLGGRFAADGFLALAALIAAQVLALQALAGALGPAAGGPAPARRSAALLAPAAVGMLTITPLLVYQLDYDQPLGFPNELVLVATAAALGAAALRPVHRPAGPQQRAAQATPLLVAASVVVVVGVAALAASWDGEQAAAGSRGSGVVMTWNLHYGVTPAGSVDLEAVARTIEAEDPDVVLLQEVSRGWVQGGGVDMASWLSHRLGRPFAFAPAADRRFGNAVLARRLPVAVAVVALPYGEGPQRRSALSAEVPVGDQVVRVTSVHLQHRADATPTRLHQLSTLLEALPGQGQPVGAVLPELVGGDLNAGPGAPEPDALGRAGFVSAVDAAGDPRALTQPSPAPRRRIDWLFGRDIGFREARVLTGVTLSDHLPVVARTDR